MKLLLDENLPQVLRDFIPHHVVFTAAYMGWQSIENGALIALAAEHGFDAVITADRGMEHEQNLSSLPVSVVVIKARGTRIDDLLPLIPSLLDELFRLVPRSFLRISHETDRA